MKIQGGLSSLKALQQLSGNKELMAKVIERIASGQRINSAADDAAGLSQSSRMSAEIASLNEAARNVSYGTAMAQTAEGGMQQIENISIRLSELATQAASSNSGADREAINTEAQALREEMDRIAGSTTYNGQTLLDGSFSTTLQVGDQNNADSRLAVSFGDLRSSALDGGGPVSLDLSTQEGAQAALGSINNVLDSLATQRAETGALLNRLDSAYSNLTVSIENKRASQSVIADADIAQESTELLKLQILSESNTAMLAQANANQASALKLLE